MINPKIQPMKKISYLLLLTILCLSGFRLLAQNSNEAQHPTLITRSENVIEVPSIAAQIASGKFIPADDRIREYNPKHWGANTAVPGKGLPKGNDPLWQKQAHTPLVQGRAPILSFDAASASATPSDPTGAVGPNHFVNSWNSSFRIWDKSGNPLIAAASLGTILPGTMGDPIVMYDPFADRFLITEFYSNGFDVAVSKGADPVNSGWWVYRFATNTFPDYPKFSVWSDGYYITANKDQGSAGTSQVVFALERDKMLIGNTSALMLGFPLTGIVTSGFYSPLGFNANGPTMPLPGNAPIVYMQDDAWSGVTSDHLKIWSVNVNWTTPSSSTISSPQILPVAIFDGLFDGGSFSNLPQPSGSDIDCLQATIMYMAQYRRFATYNTVVFNFVVDLDNADNHAGIRWYELRQTTAGAPWTIYQEGTYAQPGGHSAFCGNMCMDIYGNIGMAYTVVSSTQNPALRFTGRLASDPLGTMTLVEDTFINGTSIDPSSRYGDYAQMTIDPVDGRTFWSISEYFASGRKNRASTFQIAPPTLTAQFSGTPTTVCTGGSVVFTDQSLASPTSWTWSFPGGTPSGFVGQTPPAITYNTAGVYDVTLTVSDGSTTDPEVKTGYITVKDVIANFTGTPTTVVVGNSVTFTDFSSCTPATWAWSFPGGTPSSSSLQTPPPISYLTTGTYDVSLTVTKAGGTDTKTRTGYITVTPPIFNITNGSITTCNGDFYDTGGPTGAYQDGETITETFYPATAGNMMRFTFTSFSTESGYDTLTIYNGINSSAPLIGKYHGSVSPGMVTASNVSGALTFRFRSDASVTSTGWAATISCYNITVPPVADFSASTTNPTLGQTVTFTDLSTNVPTSWIWSFTPASVIYVGGTTAASKNPQVQFTALGPYSVTLTATNGYGSNTITKTNYINVTNCTFTTLPFSESFSGTVIPSCWTQVDNQGGGQVWQFGTLTTQSPNPVLTGNYAYLCSDCYGSGNTQNVDLVSPSMNLSDYTGINLQFSYYFKSYSGSSGTLSYSLNNGSTWTPIQQFTATSATNPVVFSQTIAALAGQSQVKFKWNYTGTWGYYWAVDNVQVTGTCISTLPVSIAVSATTNPVCANTPVLFTATPANGGTTPSFQWKVNGTSINGASNSTYTYVPTNGNAVTCVLISSLKCVTGNPATSNSLSMIVNPPLSVSVSIVASANPVNAGSSVTFTATPVNGGSTPVYQWQVNGNNAGTNSNFFTYVPANGDIVSCILTSGEACVSGNPAMSAAITMAVNSIPVIRNINDITVSGTQCFDALQSILVAGNGTSFLVSTGGIATMIAGENILYYPGTYVEPGGYMLGYIAPQGPWCTTPAMPALVAGTKGASQLVDQTSYRIFPNPTAGNFMLEWDTKGTPQKYLVEIYDMKGTKLLSRELSGEQKREFSLSGKPAGIYLIRIIGSLTSGTTRIIKQ